MTHSSDRSTHRSSASILRWHTAAQQQINQGDLEQAYDSCAAILRAAPGHADAHYLLGTIYVTMNSPLKGLELIAEAIRLDPAPLHYVDYQVRTLMQMNRLEEARSAVAILVERNRQDALIFDTIGLFYRRLDEHAQALVYLDKAAGLAPENADLQYHLATSLSFSGDFAAAEHHYEQALAINPLHHQAHFSLAESRNISADNNHIERLERVLGQVAVGSDAHLFLSYALFKELEQIRAFDRAFSILTRGNRERFARMKYDSGREKALFDRLMHDFAAVDFDQPVAACSSNRPIFVLGMPRTGTTLVDRIISSHSEVCSAGELQNFGLMLKHLTATETPQVLDPETCSAGMQVDWKQLGENYIDSLATRGGSAERVIDKMPINFYYLGHIARALPKATIICLRRNPMDTCVGNFRQLFALDLPYYQYSYDLQQTAEYYVMFDRLMQFWQAKLGSRLLQVNYEALVAEPEQQTRRIIKHCGLAWQEQCLDFHANQAPVATASVVQVREPINHRAIGRWRKYEAHLEPVKALFAAAGIEYE